MTILNYAEEALRELEKSLAGKRHRPDDAAAMEELAGYLRDGSRIELPMNGIPFDRNWTTGYQVIDASRLQLPFPTTLLEYPYELFARDPGRAACPKRVAICLDYHEHRHTLLGAAARRMCPNVEVPGGIILAACYHIETMWVPWGCGVLLPRLEPEQTHPPLGRYALGPQQKLSGIGVASFPVIPSMGEATVEYAGSLAKAVLVVAQDLAEEVHVLVNVVAALAEGARLVKRGRVYRLTQLQEVR